MAIKKEIVKLKCGIEITVYGNGNTADVDLTNMYDGYENRITLVKYSELFKELSELGYEGIGIELDKGYYDSIDGMKLNLRKK